MKPLIFILFYFIQAIGLFAQIVEKKNPPYRSVPFVPPFKIMLAPDSTVFSKGDLKKKRSTVIIVFSPDCDHCLHATRDLLANHDLFKKAQIVMATSMAFQHVQKFYNDMRIAAFSNIKVGSDNAAFLHSFYEVRTFPAIFVYDKKGKFKATFDSHAEFKKIAEVL